MIVYELKMLLEDLDEDAEVRLAMQPSWPMEYTIGDVVLVEENSSYPMSEHRADEYEPGIVYISEGDQLGYLPQRVTEDLGW